MKETKNKLISIDAPAGTRTYRFDVKTSVDGTEYLVIKELRNDNQTGRIMVFGEHIKAFRKGFRRAVRFIKKRQVQRDYPKTYTEWTEEEDYHLKHLYAHNKTIKEIAGALQREPRAINSRLKQLDKLRLL